MRLFTALAVAPTLWTFQEYMAHRFLMHNSFLMGVYASHRSHHKRPDDAKRLFIPIEITVLFAFVNGFIWTLLFDVSHALWFLAGVTPCYLAFEYVHACAHYESPSWMRSVTSHHRRHHIKTSVNFGFTSASWDLVFGTYDGAATSLASLYCSLIPFPIIPLACHERPGVLFAFFVAALPWTTTETDVDTYRETHRHPMNVLVHMWCVPILVWTGIVLLSRTCGIYASLVVALSFGVHAGSVPMTLVLLAFVWASVGLVPYPRSILFIHTISWMFQVVVGHGMWERRAPAVFDGLRSSIGVAPYVVYRDVVDAFIRHESEYTHM